ncbi:MAG: hypothetical protein L3J83_11760 [Proteobacteria bacterium]|nr:hypothetical protein [Pseudomonadota bacterium]
MSTFQDETYKSMIQYGMMMIKFCATVNGGAILALLTFIGNSHKNGFQLDMTCPIIIYVAGVFCAGMAMMGAYIIQKTLYDGFESVWGYRLTWVFASISIGCFLVGSIIASSVIAG